MTGNLAALATRMKALRAAVPVFANQKKIEMARTIHDELLQRTPVDTGTAMSNWLVLINALAINTVDASAPSPRGETIGGEWTHAVEPEVTRAANIDYERLQSELVLSEAQPGDTIFIANNLAYIRRLDQGSSSQAPQGFVDASILVALYKFEQSSDVVLTY